MSSAKKLDNNYVDLIADEINEGVKIIEARSGEDVNESLDRMDVVLCEGQPPEELLNLGCGAKGLKIGSLFCRSKFYFDNPPWVTRINSPVR